MRKAQNLGDDRNKGSCVHCGGYFETVDHNPSRVFLDDPLPPDLPTNPSCSACNNSFSIDEAYLACLIECAAVGDWRPEALHRPKIKDLLRRDAGLSVRMRTAKRCEGETILWETENERVAKVIQKLARGHVAFEVNEPHTSDPEHLSFVPLHTMNSDALDFFEHANPGAHIWPEVGSRAMMRMQDLSDPFQWLVVQEGRYRYRVTQGDGLWVRMVIREYLAAEVWWP